MAEETKLIYDDIVELPVGLYPDEVDSLVELYRSGVMGPREIEEHARMMLDGRINDDGPDDWALFLAGALIIAAVVLARIVSG